MSLPLELIIEYEEKEKKTKEWDKSIFKLDRKARKILDAESPMFLDIYKLSSEVFSNHGIHRANVDFSKVQSKNLEELLTLIISLWLITLLYTGKNVKSLRV